MNQTLKSPATAKKITPSFQWAPTVKKTIAILQTHPNSHLTNTQLIMHESQTHLVVLYIYIS